MLNSFLAPGLLGVEIAGKGGRGVFAEQPMPSGRLLVVFGGTLSGVLNAVGDAIDAAS